MDTFGGMGAAAAAGVLQGTIAVDAEIGSFPEGECTFVTARPMPRRGGSPPPKGLKGSGPSALPAAVATAVSLKLNDASRRPPASPTGTPDSSASAETWCDRGTSSEGLSELGPVNELSADELGAVTVLRDRLVHAGVPPEKIATRPLVVTYMCCKCNLDQAQKKYQKLILVMEMLGLHSWEQAFSELYAEARGESADWTDLSKEQNAMYAPAGIDAMGRSILWIKGKPIRKGGEALALRSGLLIWLSVHSDTRTMRQGMTCVIDSKTIGDKPTGTERKMQAAWQTIPLRPQKIFFIGTAMWKRALINVLVTVGQLFTKEKITDRLSFASPKDLDAIIPVWSRPAYFGGGDGGLEDITKWCAMRYRDFPVKPEQIGLEH